MSEEKKEKSRWVDAVSRMIELTQQGKMRWSALNLLDKITEDERRTTAYFQTTYNGKLLRLYGKRVRERDLMAELFDMSSERQPQYRMVNRTVLEFVNGEGATLWAFPHVDALNDLLIAVQYQVAGVSDFLNGLFDETNAAA